ncbi:hypothetical protein Vlu01_48840 [Micromonospora lutea]|uniref:Uncharacterized protein n=1 Tax=Micromonospora lutea TaxID=419825 RepID=A0ABQ4J2N5_9ACTN|nr:hypothetical protein Vlu01_48840 [Micromonospora lutea]
MIATITMFKKDSLRPHSRQAKTPDEHSAHFSEATPTCLDLANNRIHGQADAADVSTESYIDVTAARQWTSTCWTRLMVARTETLHMRICICGAADVTGPDPGLSIR